MKSASKSDFGSLLRKTRREAGKTLGDLARLLSVSVVYVSDIERGNRSPFGTSRIEKAAEFLNVDPRDLIQTAAKVRGAFEVSTKNLPDEALDFVAGLARGEQHSDSFWSELEKLIKKDKEDV